MKLIQLIKKLSEFEPTDHPFISVYLNAEPNEHGRDDFAVFLKKQLSIHQADLEENTPERRSFDRDFKRINEYMKNIPASADGVAIFACAEAGDFFETREFDVPFENDHFFVFDRPHIFPLARLYEQNPKYAVVAADTHSARIHVFKRRRALETEEIENTKTSRSDQGGWSQARFQRHIDNFHEQHAKDVIGELDKIVRDENLRQIILVGDENVIIPLLKKELTPFLEEKVIGTLRLNIDTPDHELLGASEKVLHRHDRMTDQEKIEQLKEQDYEDGLGVTGVEKTFAALANGQVQELYVSAKLEAIEYDAAGLAEVLENYAPGLGGEDLPQADKERLLVDELLKLGFQTAEQVRFIEDENLLRKSGGIGALLRYRGEEDLISKATG